MTDTSEEAAKKRAEEQLSSAMAGMVHDSTEAETAEAEAEAKRQEKQRAQEHAAAKVGLP